MVGPQVFVFLGQRLVPARRETICERQRILISLESVAWVSVSRGRRDDCDTDLHSGFGNSRTSRGCNLTARRGTQR